MMKGFQKFILIGMVLAIGLIRTASADVLDYADAAAFKDLGANSGYGNCTITPVANPTDGSSYTVRACVTAGTCPASGCQGFHIPFLWPPTANVTTGTCTVQVDALNPSADTSTTTWGAEVACCATGTSCVNKTYGTQRTMTLTNTATAVDRLITAVNGAGAAPASYTGLAAGNWCDFRVTRLHNASYSNASPVSILGTHVVCQ
jgi:hypothetical protein